MSWYDYKSKSGAVVELEFPIGTAPQSIEREGVIFERVYAMPTIRQLSPLDRGDKPALGHSLPRWYGYGQREVVWKEHMQKLGLEDTPHRRRQLRQANLVPSPKLIERRSRQAAARAGALDKFTKTGIPIAPTKRGVRVHLDTAKKLGDKLEWD